MSQVSQNLAQSDRPHKTVAAPHFAVLARGNAPIPFYFVCSLCDAKWFAETPAAWCPRCRTSSTSNERLTPPWWKGATS